jgi:hypothetical protein
MNRSIQIPTRPDGRAYPGWSIGIYAGPSLQALASHPDAHNPVLTRHDVTDIPAGFLADPFLAPVDNGWLMFMEVMNAETGRGEIGLARSRDGVEWSYEGVVLREPFHLSYPYVFEADGRHYMVPETLDAGAVCLYVGDPFPTKWRRLAEMIPGQFADPSIFAYGGRWWLLCCGNPHGHDMLNLFSAPTLEGAWVEHVASPLIEKDKQSARPAGRVLICDGRPVRFAQDCAMRYGTAVHGFRVTDLGTTTYAECPLQDAVILGPGEESWNRIGMHHLDPHQLRNGEWLACVDGCGPAASG